MKKKGIDRVLFPLATAILLGLFSGQAFASGQAGNAATEGKWQQEGNNWKYLDASGQEKTGWVESKGQWYYVDPQSKNLKSGWMEKDGKWFFLDTKADSLGKMATGWQWVDGYCYYFAGDSGRMYQNEKTPDGFFVQEGGKCANEKGEPLFDLSKGVQSTKEKEAVAEQARKDGKSLEEMVSLVAAVKTEAPASSQASGSEDNAGSIKFSGVIKSAGGSGGGGGGSFGGGGGSGSSGGGSFAPKAFGGSASSGGSGGGGGGSSSGGSFVPKAVGTGSSWQTSYNPSTKNPFATKEELYRFHEENELKRKQEIAIRNQEQKKQEQERLEKQKEEQRQRAQKERQDALEREKQALREKEARERFQSFRSAIEGELDDPGRLQEYSRKDGKKLSLFAKGISLHASSFRKDNELTIAKNTYYIEVIPYYASSGFYDTDNLAERVYGYGEEKHFGKLSYYAAERDALRHAIFQKRTEVENFKASTLQIENFKAKIFGKLHSLNELYTDALNPREASAYALYPKQEESSQSQRASASTLSRTEGVASSSTLEREEAQRSTLPENLKNEALFDEHAVDASNFSALVLEYLQKGEVLLLEHSGFNKGGNQIAVVYGAEWDGDKQLTALYLTEPDDRYKGLKRYPVQKLGKAGEEKLFFTPDKSGKVQSKLKKFYTLKLYEGELENLFLDITG